MHSMKDTMRILVVPTATALTIQQNAGNVCVWCPRPIFPSEGVDLGGARGWAPHAYRTCYRLQTRALVTYFDWVDHLHGCVPCRAALCDTSRSHLRVHLEAREKARRPAPYCGWCRHTVSQDRLFIPYVWRGNSRPMLSYAHVPDCSLPADA
ncbi:hypothetical protein [Streptomyces lasiicapitis]|uniref:C2H2-type domain-containing protein n=1 Tax=Streptomyces lasiicapitis TaxID=1923961 RepID=A0ABQ2MZV4_9ACTN|nr:hypothetical protein [Streptomyces lasiicapitis]GGO59041.1 hypothetical protein GCM10012286_79730 [Streptomyces lasiicapitis]